jgi:uncharacterized membrane protein
MNRPTRILLTAAFGLLSVLSAQAANILGHALTPTYSLTALPLVPGATRELITDINNQGTVIGSSLDTPEIPFAYSHGHFTVIEPNTATQVGQNALNGINNLGVVIGTMWNGQANVGFAYFNGKTITVNPSAGSLESYPSSINDLGQIVGYVSPAGLPINSNDHIFLRQPNGTYVDLGAFGTDPEALINNQGTIVITASNSDMTLDSAYIRQPGSTKLQQIPPSVPGTSVEATSINNLGVIAGNNSAGAFVYANGKITELGALPPVGINPGSRYSFAESINVRGQVVGNAYQDESLNPPDYQSLNLGYIKGFIYYAGAIHDLNAMLPASAKGWVIEEAWSINDEGQIAATAQYQGGYPQPVILTPNEILP